MTTATQPKSKNKTFARGGLLAIALAVSVLALAVHSAKAAGSATFSVTPASGSYTVGDTINAKITENSGAETVNAIKVDLSYDPSVLQYTGLDGTGSAFNSVDLSTGASGGIANISRAQLNAHFTGSQTVGTLIFKVIGAASASALRFAGSSAIVSTDQSNLWNTDPTGASYTLKAAATTPAPTGGGTPTTPAASTPSSSSSSSKSTAAGGSTSSKSSSTPGASSTNPAAGSTTTTPNTTGATGDSPGILTPGTYFIAIKVHDSKNKAVVGASVSLDNKTLKTDANGLAGFIGVPVGTYSAKIAYSGKTQTETVKVVKPASDSQNLQEFNVKLASSSTPSWIIYVIILLVIIGLGTAGFIIPRKNRFNPPQGMGPTAAETMVVGDLSKPAPTDGQTINPQTPGIITKPTSEEQKP